MCLGERSDADDDDDDDADDDADDDHDDDLNVTFQYLLMTMLK